MAEQENLEIKINVVDEGSAAISNFGKNATDTTEKVAKSAEGMKKGWTDSINVMQMASVAGGMLIAQALGKLQELAKNTLKYTIGAAAEEEVQLKQLENTVNIVGGSFESSSGSIDSFIASMQSTTQFGDGEMRPVLQQITLLTGDLNKGFEGARLAADMAASGLFDLDSAARYVAMAMEGNTMMLGRYIPELKDAAMAQAGVKTEAEKAAYAMEVLNEKFGGMAEANLETFNAQTKKLGNYLGDLGEAIGGIFLPVLTKVASGLATVAEEIAKSITIISSTVLVEKLEAVPLAIELTTEKALELSQKLIKIDEALAGNVIGSSAAVGAWQRYRDAIEKTLNSYEDITEKQKQNFEITVKATEADRLHTFNLIKLRAELQGIKTDFEAINKTGLSIALPTPAGYELSLSVTPPDFKTAEQIAEWETFENTKTEASKIASDLRIKNAEDEARRKQEQNQIFFAAWDTGIRSMIDAELSGKSRREAIWSAFTSAAISYIGKITFAYITSEEKKTAVTLAQHAIRLATWAVEKAALIVEAGLNLISAAAKIFSAHASLPFVGIGIAAGMIAAMYGIMKNLPKFATGGEINEGPSGVDRVLIAATRGEYVINKSSTQRYKPLLDAINSNSLTTAMAGGSSMGRYASGGMVNRGLNTGGGVNIIINTQMLDEDVIERKLIPKLREIGLLQGA